jgi:hypothetical protein
MRKIALLLMLFITALLFMQTPVARADYFNYPCNYPFVGTGGDAKLGVIDAGGQYCDGPTEINWTHYHCWSGGATVNVGAFAFAPVGPLSLGGFGGSGIGGNGGVCRYVCPDGMIAPFPNPPAAWIKHLVLDPRNSDCVGHMGIRGDTSTPMVNQLPGNMKPGEDPPDGVPVPDAPGGLPPGQRNPDAKPGPPPPALPDESPSPLAPGSPIALP